MSDVEDVVPIASNSNGRVSGKSWKSHNTATVYGSFLRTIPLFELKISRRTHLPPGVKTKKWEDRMQKTEKARAIKKLQAELRDEKQSEIQRRRQMMKGRTQAIAERRRLEDERAKVRVLSHQQTFILHNFVASSANEGQQDSVVRWVERRKLITKVLVYHPYIH